MTGAEFLVAAAIVGSMASAAQGVSAYQQGKRQARTQRLAAERASAISLQNADLARELGERNAKATLNKAASDERSVRLDRRRRIAAARAGFGAMGAQITGTPLEVLSDAIMSAELDAHLVRHQGAVGAANARLEAELTARREEISASGALWSGEAAAQMSLMQGNAALIAGLGQAGSTLLTGFDEARFRNDLFNPSESSGGGGPLFGQRTFP